MTASRYTSAALSRALRDAGLSQEGAERVWYYSDTVKEWRLAAAFEGQPMPGGGPNRALCLGDVMDELEKVGVVEAAGLLLLAVLKAKVKP